MTRRSPDLAERGRALAGRPLDCPPRLGTARNPERSTLGPSCEAWSLMMTGHRFMPWQRYVVDVGLELDPASDPDDPRLWYEVIVLKVPRQSGKTTLAEAKHVTATRRGPDRTSVLAEQSLLMARKRLLDELEHKRLARSPLLSPLYKVRRSNGDEWIRWTDAAALDSVIVPIANTDDAGHGLTVDDATVDEAFCHRDLTIVVALDPTMITRPDPQLWIMSTIGDGRDGLLQHYEEVGETSLTDPATKVAYFDWSATEHHDRADPATWWEVMPALGHTQTEAAVRRRFETTPPDEFDRSYLCRRPAVAASAKLPAELWAACGVDLDDLVHDGPVVLGVAVSLDRSHSTIAVAGRLAADPDRVAVAVERRPGTAWAGRRLAELSGRNVITTVADRRAGAGTIIDDAVARGVVVDEVGAAEVSTYCGSLYDLVVTGRLAHGRQPELDTAAGGAVDRPLGDAWAWSATRSEVPVDPITASTWAVGRYVTEYPAGVERGRPV